MKKLNMAAILCLLPLLFSGCAIGEKSGTAVLIYGVAAVISLLLFIGCCILERKRSPWILVLFTSVLVVNAGYFWLSVAPTLGSALMANRLSYLGSVFLPLSMLMIILNTTGFNCRKWLPNRRRQRVDFPRHWSVKKQFPPAASSMPSRK